MMSEIIKESYCPEVETLFHTFNNLCNLCVRIKLKSMVVNDEYRRILEGTTTKCLSLEEYPND